MDQLLKHQWHKMPAEEVVRLLETDVEKGLDIFEVKRRRESFGPNAIAPTKGKAPSSASCCSSTNPWSTSCLLPR